MEVITAFFSGSMRTSVEGLVTSQMDPAPTVMPPSELAGSAGICAMILPSAGSKRVRTWSPQLGDQSEPKALARPEHGSLTGRTLPMVLVAARSWTMWLSRPVVTQRESAVTTDQSGLPGMVKAASFLTSAMEREMPGILPPMRPAGGRGTRQPVGGSERACLLNSSKGVVGVGSGL